MLHRPRLSCANCGRPQRPCIASREQAAFVMSGRRVSRQGWSWDAVTTRGIYEPVPGLLDTLFVPKVG
jgi:hypothetical protein